MLTHSFIRRFLLNYNDLRVNDGKNLQFNSLVNWKKKIKDVDFERVLGPFSVPPISKLWYSPVCSGQIQYKAKIVPSKI